jgi:hypothetical protein
MVILKVRILKSILLVGFFSSIFLFNPSPAFAHEYESSGSIQGVLHVDPDDNASSNSPAQLNLSIVDNSNQFLGSHCNCTISVVSDKGKKVLSSTIFTGPSADNNVAVLPIIFPDLGRYTITVTATPKPGYVFKSFQLVFHQDISHAGPKNYSQTLRVIGVAILLIGVALTFLFFIFSNRQKAKTNRHIG